MHFVIVFVGNGFVLLRFICFLRGIVVNIVPCFTKFCRFQFLRVFSAIRKNLLHLRNDTIFEPHMLKRVDAIYLKLCQCTVQNVYRKDVKALSTRLGQDGIVIE